MEKYSVVIRTLGKTGEKYATLLESIKNLSEQPEEVIVVLPYGYAIPKERIGIEKFVFSEKGLVYQRIAGVKAAKNELVLCLDDDLKFDNLLAERLSKPILEGKCDVTIPCLPDILPAGRSALKMFFIGSAVPLIFGKSKWYLKILGNGGYAYNKYYKRDNSPEYLECQTAPCACFMVRKKCFLNIRFDDELWLENKIGYAYGDDQALFYKFYLNGNNVFLVTSARIIHLDGAASQSGNNMRREYASGYFREVFYDRFIFRQEKNLIKYFKKLSYEYSKAVYSLFIRFNGLKNIKYEERYKGYIQGLQDAKIFLKSDEYGLLHNPIVQ